MTRLFGVIGSPISHSLSPAMHAAALRAMRLDALYTAVDVPPKLLSPMLRGLILAGVDGLNVTVPLKEVVMPLMDRLDPTARAIGAVNTIVIRHHRTIGYNTDGVGFIQAIRELGWSPHLPQPTPTGGALRDAQGPSGQRQVVGWRARPAASVILGAGGAARAVAWELSRIRGSCLTIANRNLSRARRFARWLARARPQACVRASSLRAVSLDGVDLLVNATTVGMRASDGLLVEPTALRRGLLVYDLVYHRETALVRAARRRGCLAANGASMLVYQGAESLRLWLHRRPPIEVMRKALRQALEKHQ